MDLTTVETVLVQEAQNKLQKGYDDIAKIQVKCESMEKFLVEMKEKKGAK